MLFEALILPLLLQAAPPVVITPRAPATAAAPSPEAMEAALALFDDMDLEQQMLAAFGHVMDASLKTQLEALRAQGKEMPEKVVIRLRGLLAEQGRQVVKDVLPTIRPELAAIYARRFTAEELRELKRLQSQPVMQKAQKLLPEMFAEMSQIGGRAAAARSAELKQKIERMVAEVMEEERLGQGPTT